MLSKLLGLFKSNKVKPSLGELATSMGLESRRHYRALYPSCHSPYILPQICFEDFSVKAKDISEGGFCITSNSLTEKLQVGVSYEFELQWSDEKENEVVQATLIGVSFERIHFQFNKIDDSATQRLSEDISVASRGMKMTPSFLTLNSGIETDCKELWANRLGDKLLFKKDRNLWVEGSWCNSEFQLASDENGVIFPDSWSRPDRSKFAVFLTNIPAPSADLKLLIAALMQTEQRRESA